MRLFLPFFVAVIALTAVAPAFADSPADYRQSVAEALSIVRRALEQKDASPSAAAAEAVQVLDRIRVVEAGDGRQVAVDNGWAVAPLKKSPPDLATAENRLQQLLDELDGRSRPTIAAEKAETTLRHEAEKLLPLKKQRMVWDDWLDGLYGFFSPIVDLLGRLWAWIQGLLRGGESSQIERGVNLSWWIIGALALAAVAAALGLLTRSLRRAVVSEGAAGATEVEPERLASDEVLVQVQAFAAAGHLRDAVRALYLATVLHLDEREQVRFDPSLTNREYLRKTAGQERLTEALRVLVATFDSSWYGQRICTPAEFEECCRQARAIGLAI